MKETEIEQRGQRHVTYTLTSHGCGRLKHVSCLVFGFEIKARQHKQIPEDSKEEES